MEGKIVKSIIIGIVLLGGAVFLGIKSPFVANFFCKCRQEENPEISRLPLSGAFSSALTQTGMLSPIHLEAPASVKGIYATSCTISSESRREELIQLITDTELNAVIIDIKDYTGTISFKPQHKKLEPAYENSICKNNDLTELISQLHQKNIYAIARIVVFQDPFLSQSRPDLAIKKKDGQEIWKDNKGLSFTDPGSQEVWDYNIALAREAYNLGFDEINFDYVRFPSDGPTSDTYFPFSENRPKSDVLEEFFAYLNKELKPIGAMLSVDLFGLTCTSNNDLNIGQILEKALPYFDYVCPMVYPSHYPNNFLGFSDPNLFPYEIVHLSLLEAAKRTQSARTTFKTINSELVASSSPLLYTKKSYDPLKLRPWLQDFNYGGNYTADKIRAQMQATYDAGLNSWMLWNPGNKYTKDALDTN